MILDIHSHRQPPYPEGILSFSPEALPAPGDFPGQFYSVGIHPWDVAPGTPAEDSTARLREQAHREDVVALGECGIDMAKGGMLFLQRKTFSMQAQLAEEVGKPMVIHCVRAHDHIIAFRQDLKPKQNWAIHSFRNKATVAEMLLKAGIWLSFGSRFNEEALLVTPANCILAETDEERTDILDVIAALSAVRPDITSGLIKANTARFLGI